MSESPDPIIPESTFADVTTDGIPWARPIGVPAPRSPHHGWLQLDLTKNQACADLLTLLGALFVVDLAMGAVLSIAAAAAGMDMAEGMREWVVVMLGARAIAAAGVVAFVLRRRKQTRRSVGLNASRLGIKLLVGLGALPVVVVLNQLATFTILSLWPAMMEQMQDNVHRIQEMLPKMHPLTFAGVTLLIAGYEELVFRGFLMPRLRRITGSWVLAVLISTTLFTALHAFDQELIALVSIAILSLVFSLMTIWQRSILPAIVAHAVYDLSVLLWVLNIAGEGWR